MRSTYALAVLVGFALVNTAFLGAYLYSSAAAPATMTGAQSYTLSSTTAPLTVTGTITASTSTTITFSTTTAPSASYTVSGAPGANGGLSSLSTSRGSLSGLTALSFLQFFEVHSLALAPSSWAAVGGMWIWRGRMKSRWRDLGFDSDVFGLFVKMKGGKTRMRLLDALSFPKDRLQLAQELGLDWKGVDRHLMLMKKYGFVDDRVAYGKVRMYQLTPTGQSLLRFLQELSREERHDAPPPAPLYDAQVLPP
jgi:hypothetical protein